jgi:hypothetical protein
LSTGDLRHEVRLTPLGIWRISALLYRRHWLRVGALAGLVLAPLGLAGGISEMASADLPPEGSVGPMLAEAGLGIGATLLTLLAEIFYAGVVDITIGPDLERGEALQLLAILRALPFRRLLRVQLLATAVIVAGFVLLLVPGLVALTLLCIAGPVAVLVEVGAVRALRTSARLVAPYWWLAALVVFVPEICAGLVEEVVGALLPDAVAATILSTIVLSVTITAFEGVAIAVLGHALVVRARSSVRRSL